MLKRFVTQKGTVIVEIASDGVPKFFTPEEMTNKELEKFKKRYFDQIAELFNAASNVNFRENYQCSISSVQKVGSGYSKFNEGYNCDGGNVNHEDYSKIIRESKRKLNRVNK